MLQLYLSVSAQFLIFAFLHILFFFTNTAFESDVTTSGSYTFNISLITREVFWPSPEGILTEICELSIRGAG